MKIFYCIKELIPKTSLNRRGGEGARRAALLRVVFYDGLEGFANLHPNPERLGTTLEQELAILAETCVRTPSPLVGEGLRPPAGGWGEGCSVQIHQSLKLARFDAEARA